MAQSGDLVWGRDIIFTYGPLGIAVFPVAESGGTLLLALLLAGAIQFLLVAVLFVAFRRQYGPLGSTLLTFLVASAVGSVQSDATLVAGFGLAVLAVSIDRRRAQHAAWALAVGGGALAAFTLLVKLNDGVAVAVIIAVALASSPSPRRALALAFGTGFVTLLILWLLAGQPLLALGDYGRNAIDTISGYVEAMGLEEAGRAGEWQLPVLIGSAAALAWLAWTSFPELSNRRLGAMVAGILLMHYFVLREVFVRHSVTRGAYFVLLIPVALMIPWPRQRRPLALAIAAVLAVAYTASYQHSPDEIWAPRERATKMVEQLNTAVDGGRLDRLQADSRAGIEAESKVPPRIIEALRGRCVNAEPTEIAVVWAYDLDWCPLPSLQSYNAFTTRLDRLNADRYADPEDGPDGVIRTTYAIDGRLPAWESPQAMLALLCNFKSVAVEGEWQALVRIPNRCGEPREVGAVEGELGEPIEVPPAPRNTVLLAHVKGLEIGAFERLEMLFGRPEMRTISIDGSRPYRVVPDTVDDGLIVSVPPGADYPGFFDLGVDAAVLTPVVNNTEGDVTIEFSAVPIR